MVILIKGKLETLDYFIDAMAKDHDEVVVFDINNPEETLLPIVDKIDKDTLVVTFNNLGTSFDIWKSRGAKIVNIMVDHPAFYIPVISRDYYTGYYGACIDRYHADYLKELFPTVENSFLFLPHGGMDKGGMNYDKDIDILYAGSFLNDEDINFLPLPFEHNSEQFYRFLLEYYKSDSSKEPQDVVKAYMQHYGYTFKIEEYLVMVEYTLKTVGLAFQAIRRKRLVEELAMVGMNIHICGGDGWKELADKYSDNITFHGKLSPAECLEMICRSKVLLNDHPNFAAGSHERVFNGMLNGAVVLSNYSEYLADRFTDAEDILFWDGMNYIEALDKVKTVLQDDLFRTRIMQNAYAKAKNDTWSSRLSEITSIFVGRQ